jgi:hypothetical protein
MPTVGDVLSGRIRACFGKYAGATAWEWSGDNKIAEATDLNVCVRVFIAA